MNLAQLVVVCLASASVARAFISLGLMSYKMKWLNYAIALMAGILGAWFGLINPAFKNMALVVSVLFAIVALALYHGLRWYFVLDKTIDSKNLADLESEQNFLAIESKN
jgi:hypothetical protein